MEDEIVSTFYFIDNQIEKLFRGNHQLLLCAEKKLRPKYPKNFLKFLSTINTRGYFSVDNVMWSDDEMKIILEFSAREITNLLWLRNVPETIFTLISSDEVFGKLLSVLIILESDESMKEIIENQNITNDAIDEFLRRNNIDEKYGYNVLNGKRKLIKMKNINVY